MHMENRNDASPTAPRPDPGEENDITPVIPLPNPGEGGPVFPGDEIESTPSMAVFSTPMGFRT